MENQEKPLIIEFQPEKRVPKICNLVQFSRFNNGEIMLTLLFQEPMVASESPDKINATLIERIIIDKDHAKQIIEKLGGIIKE